MVEIGDPSFCPCRIFIVGGSSNDGAALEWNLVDRIIKLCIGGSMRRPSLLSCANKLACVVS